MRDAAYQSLLKSRRQQLHAGIAKALEERFPRSQGRARAAGAALRRAGSAERAVRHWRRAAELAIGRSANLEAIAHCEQAEVQLQAVPPSAERARAELEVLLAKGVAVRAAKGYSAPEAERVFLRARELCEELGDRVRSVHALRGLWAFYEWRARWRTRRGSPTGSTPPRRARGPPRRPGRARVRDRGDASLPRRADRGLAGFAAR